jgi:hypothetical protein
VEYDLWIVIKSRSCGVVSMWTPAHGELVGNTSMTAVANLLARKQKLLEQFQNDPAAHERDEIERQLKQIDATLNLLEGIRPVDSNEPPG